MTSVYSNSDSVSLASRPTSQTSHVTCSDEGREEQDTSSGFYLSTGSNSGQNKKCRPPVILAKPMPDIRYDGERFEMMTKASRYRLQHLRPPLPEPYTGSISLGAVVIAKSMAKRVRRKPKRIPDVIMDHVDIVGSPLSGRSSLEDQDLQDIGNTGPTQKQKTAEGTNDEAPSTEIPLNEGVLDERNRDLYQLMCRNLDVAPSRHFLRHLASEKVVMRHHLMGSNGVKACMVALLDNHRVKDLDLGDNNMGSTGVLFVADMLKENYFITKLDLGENGMGTEGVMVLADVLNGQDYLQILNISGNGFEEDDAIYIARILQENCSLLELIVSHNHFMESGGTIIAKALAQNYTLELFDISWNHLRTKGATSICEALYKNTTLTTLNVAWNGFSQQGCKSMAKALQRNTTLVNLDLTCNRIDLTCLNHLLRGVKANKSLTSLKLGSNSITTVGAMAILQVLDQNEAVAITDLDISGQSVDTEFLQLLTKLKEKRPLKVHHGYVLPQLGLDVSTETGWSQEDPMMVLMEFLRISNLRLVDLFTTLDKDGSKSLTREEFRDGLVELKIPMSPEAINKLIDNLDEDGDGEVDYMELLNGQKDHKRKIHRMKQREKGIPVEETEIGRINTKIRAILAFRQGASKQKPPAVSERELEDQMEKDASTTQADI